MEPSQRRSGTFAYDWVDGILFMTHGKGYPAEAEWTQHMREVAARKGETRGLFVYTIGGGPDASQRRSIQATWKNEAMPPCALLTSSPAASTLGTVMNFFFKNRMRFLKPNQLEEAVRYLGMPDSFVPRARAVVLDQARRIDIPPPPFAEPPRPLV